MLVYVLFSENGALPQTVALRCRHDRLRRRSALEEALAADAKILSHSAGEVPLSISVTGDMTDSATAGTDAAELSDDSRIKRTAWAHSLFPVVAGRKGR
jgi:hypothetical protein